MKDDEIKAMLVVLLDKVEVDDVIRMLATISEENRDTTKDVFSRHYWAGKACKLWEAI